MSLIQSRRHSYWGSFTTANLPNASGSPNTSTDLQKGDTAYDSTVNALKVAVSVSIGSATWIYVNGGALQLSGAVNEDETVTGAERVIGGFVFDGGIAASPITFRLVGVCVGAGGDFQVRLYDMGPAAGPPGAPALRSTLTIPFSGDVVLQEQDLTPDATPGVGIDEIFNTARIYELRLFLTAPATSGKAHWAGIVTGS